MTNDNSFQVDEITSTHKLFGLRGRRLKTPKWRRHVVACECGVELEFYHYLEPLFTLTHDDPAHDEHDFGHLLNHPSKDFGSTWLSYIERMVIKSYNGSV